MKVILVCIVKILPGVEMHVVVTEENNGHLYWS
jgi:hypothetical protein